MDVEVWVQDCIFGIVLVVLMVVVDVKVLVQGKDKGRMTGCSCQYCIVLVLVDVKVLVQGKDNHFIHLHFILRTEQVTNFTSTTNSADRNTHNTSTFTTCRFSTSTFERYLRRPSITTAMQEKI